MSKPRLTVEIVQQACERAGLDAMVGIALNADRTVTDFATWGRRAEDKVYADGLAGVVRSGLGYTPVPPMEDFKLQAAHLKLFYDKVMALKNKLAGKYDVREEVAALNIIFSEAEKIPRTFNPPTFTVYRATSPVDPSRPHKVEQARVLGAEDLCVYLSNLRAEDKNSLREWIDNVPLPADCWRDDRCELLVVRNSDI